MHTVINHTDKVYMQLVNRVMYHGRDMKCNHKRKWLEQFGLDGPSIWAGLAFLILC